MVGVAKVKQGVAEGAPELLKKEMPLHRQAEKLLAQNGVSKDDPDYHHHLGNTIKHLRQFGNIDLINKSDEQGVAEGSEEEDVAAARAARAKLDKPAIFRKQEKFLPSKDKDWMVTPDELTAAGELPSREFALRKKERGLEEDIVDIKRLAGLK
jgi:hypothetical protein